MLVDFPIIARNISYSSGFKKIINNISFALKKSEFVGLIGGSGSGKTTLLTCLNGYREPDNGSVIVNGFSSSDKKKLRHLIGYVPQDDIVHKTLTVERSLYYAYLLRIDNAEKDKAVKDEVEKVLGYLDLKEHKNKKISSLSGGQRKRVNIGIELLHSPNLFFLDEPTAGLDPSLERQLMRLLNSLANQNRLVILTTHLMQHVDMFDVLIFIHKGEMIYFGPSEEITTHFKVRDMIELFDKVLIGSPTSLKTKFLKSSVYRNFLLPRINGSANV